jgi:hypothetical protein
MYNCAYTLKILFVININIHIHIHIHTPCIHSLTRVGRVGLERVQHQVRHAVRVEVEVPRGVVKEGVVRLLGGAKEGKGTLM